MRHAECTVYFDSFLFSMLFIDFQGNIEDFLDMFVSISLLFPISPVSLGKGKGFGGFSNFRAH